MLTWRGGGGGADVFADKKNVQEGGVGAGFLVLFFCYTCITPSYFWGQGMDQDPLRGLGKRETMYIYIYLNATLFITSTSSRFCFKMTTDVSHFNVSQLMMGCKYMIRQHL